MGATKRQREGEGIKTGTERKENLSKNYPPENMVGEGKEGVWKRLRSRERVRVRREVEKQKIMKEKSSRGASRKSKSGKS